MKVVPPTEIDGRRHDGSVTYYAPDESDRTDYGVCWICDSEDVVAFDRARPHAHANCFCNLCERCIEHAQLIVGVANGTHEPHE
jgi:hypothetical protein